MIEHYKRGDNLPKILKQQIIEEYISGLKTSTMLGREHGLNSNSICTMVRRYKKEHASALGDHLSIIPLKPIKTSADNVTLRKENESLRRQLKIALLKLKGFQILGEILDEQYGIDLLKNAVMKENSYLKSKGSIAR